MDASASELFFANVVDRLSSAASLDIATLETLVTEINLQLDKVAEERKDPEKIEKKDGTAETSTSHEDRCLNDPLALNCFLTNVVQAVERNPGQEDNILRDLFSFCSRNGMMLPPSDEETNDINRSQASLNAIVDEDEEETLMLWHKIKARLKVGVINKLEKTPLLNRNDCCEQSYQREAFKRVELVELVLTLVPPETVLDLYIRLRQDQLEMYVAGSKKQSVSWADEENRNKIRQLECLESLVIAQLDMMNEDTFVLSKLQEVVPGLDPAGFVSNVYLDDLNDCIDKFVNAFTDTKQDAGFLQRSPRSTRHQNVCQPLNFDDIRLISKGYALLLSWEREVDELMQNSLGGFSQKGQEDLSPTIRSVLKGSPGSSPSSSHKEELNKLVWDEQLDRGKSGTENYWPWREQFEALIKSLSDSIVDLYGDFASSVQFDEPEEGLAPVDVDDELYDGNEDYPLKVPKKCALIITALDEILPLASQSNGAIFQPVQTAFIEAATRCFRDYSSELSELLDGFPNTTTVESVYTVLSACAFFKKHLSFYDDVMKVSGRKPFSHSSSSFDDLLQNGKKLVISFHLKILTSSILHDTHSNNWTDFKAFYEGERCSFCIQSWSFYLKSIWSDIWCKLPPTEAKDILFTVANECLTILVGRYSRARPSFARVKQYRADVSVIIDVYNWLLWNLSNSVTELFAPRPLSDSRLCGWHSLCSSMLATTLFVAAPISLVAERITLPQESSQPEQEGERLRNLWLHWSQPYLFTMACKSLSDVGDKEAVTIVFKMLVSQPTASWPHVLQAMTMRDAFLPILITSYAGEFVQISRSSIDSGFGDKVLNDNFVEAAGQQSSNLNAEDFASHVYHVLLETSGKSNALAQYLMALANKENDWSLLEQQRSQASKEMIEVPLWLRCIEPTMIAVLARVLLPSLELLCHEDRLKAIPSFTFTELTKLPCGCPAKQETTSHIPQAEGQLLYQCLCSTLDLLTENIVTVPRIICVFFKRLEDYLHQRHFIEASTSPGLKIVANTMYRWLTTQENVSSMFEFPITDDTMGQIRSFAELVWHVLYNQTVEVSQNPSIRMEITSFIKGNKAKLQQQLEILKEHFTTSGAKPCGYNLDQSPEEFVECQYKSTTATVISTPKGRNALKFIYNIMKANKVKIQEKLVGASLLNNGNEEGSSCSLFNPLTEYGKFGENSYNQEMLIEQDVDWVQWLSHDFGFPPLLVKRIILSRNEFLEQSYEYLTEEEKQAVEKLRRYFCDPDGSSQSDTASVSSVS